MLRRSFLIGTAAAVAVGTTEARAAETRRTFRILRGGDDIGRHSLAARLTDGVFEIDIDIDIRVTLLGFTAYSYTLTNRERWRDGTILSVDSQTDDDGDAAYARIRGSVDGLEIDGSGYSGRVRREAVTTSYFATEFLTRRPWISSQSGKPLDIAVPEKSVPGQVRVTGELETTLIYDAEGEWRGSRFDARGSTITYELIEESGSIADLWRTA